MVTPYNPALLDDDDFDTKKPSGQGKRYNNDLVDGNDFSRADMSGEENIGIGDDDLDEGPGAKGVFFDDEDLFGDREEKPKARAERN